MATQILAGHSNWLLDQSEAGISITGDSGKGKSVLMRQICRSVIRERLGAVFLFDPHGPLAEDVLRDCIAMGEAVRERVHYFEPGNEALPVGCLNPLGVAAVPGESEYGRLQRIDKRALDAAHLLLAAWGEENFQEKPQLYKWTTLILQSLAQLGMTIPDARFLLDVGTDLYHQLVNALPDPAVRWEFQRLAELKPFEQMETLASTKSRFMGLDAPVMIAHLGADPSRALDIPRLISEQAIVIVNFRPQKMLHPQRVAVLANFWMTEVFSAVMNMADDERRPNFVCCDELPVFWASAPMLTELLSQIRKMLTRFVGAFQGVHRFPKAAADPLLHAIEQCGTKFVFNHSGTENAEYFGRMLQLSQHDPLKRKFEYWEDQQYQDGHEEVQLLDYSLSASHSQADTDQDNWGTSREQSLSHAVTDGVDRSDTNSHSTGRHQGQDRSVGQTTGGNRGQSTERDRNMIRSAYNDSAGRSWARNSGSSHREGTSVTDVQQSGMSVKHGETSTKGLSLGESEGGSHGVTTGESFGVSQTWKTQLVPVMRWRKVLKFLEFSTRDDQIHEWASEITRLSRGECFMLSANGRVDRVQVPWTEPLETNGLFADVLEEEFFHQLPARIGGQSVPAIFDYRQRMIAAFSEELRRFALLPTERAHEDLKRLEGPFDDTGLTI